MKKCQSCKKDMPVTNTLQQACSVDCAIDLVNKNKEKAFNKETRRYAASVKTKSDWIPEVQVAFNRCIKAEDILFYLDQGKQPECISCGTTNPNIVYAAGHLQSVGGFTELRFDEDNCNLQCNKRCNKELSGNIEGTKTTHGYKKGLVKKYGELEAFRILEKLNSYHPTPKWTCEELKIMKKEFNARANKARKRINEMYLSEV